MGMKKLGQGAIGTGAGTLMYTVPSGYQTLVTNIDVANTTAAPIAFTLHLVASGGSPAASNMLFPAVSIQGKTLVQWVGEQQMQTGGFIQCIGSAAGLTVNITGDEVRANV